MSAEIPSLGEVLLEAAEFVKGTMYVHLPAEVTAYDQATQTVTVKPAVQVRTKNPITDVETPMELPQVANVPVAFPSAGDISITWPIPVGSHVLLLVADRSLDEWKAGSPRPTTPRDRRRFDLTDAIAYPGVRPIATPLSADAVSGSALVVKATEIRLGSADASDPVVTESALKAHLEALKSWVDLHVHTDPVSGTTTPPTVSSPSVPDIASTKVKAE